MVDIDIQLSLSCILSIDNIEKREITYRFAGNGGNAGRAALGFAGSPV
jgi:hypothetical protein